MARLDSERYNLKSKLRRQEKVFGMWTSLSHPSITEIFARSGVDFIGIDIEHSTISQEQSQRIIAASHSNGILCLPRIASHNMEMIKRLLDSGADGIIVPMISKPEEVKNIISWIKYPPHGRRSFGIARAQGYGFDFSEYVKTWNDSSVLIVQIESTEGVRNIEKILSYDEIDGVMVGPYDISGSLGIPGELNHPEVINAVKKVITACTGHGKTCGTQIVEPNKKSIDEAFLMGYAFIVLASDVFLLWKWSERMKSLIEQSKQNKR